SVLRTSGSDCTSWPTPCVQDGPKGGPSQGADRLPAAVHLTNWATPMRADGRGSAGVGKNELPNQAKLASWPTPVANDDNKSVEAHLAMKKRMGGNRTAITSLQVTAKLAFWSTPRANKWGFPDAHGSQESSIGLPQTGSPASTEKLGQLN